MQSTVLEAIIMRYNIDDFVNEYRGPYDAATYKAKALNIQDIYISGNLYVVNGVNRYGLYINPDAAGLAYWTDLCLANNWDITTPAFLTTIFAAADGVPGYYTRSREAFKWWNTEAAFSDRLYGSAGFLAEFVPLYNANYNLFADQALKVLIVYSSNYPFFLSNGQTRYGLFRLPDAEGLAYWTNYCIVNNRAADSAAFWNVFFATIAGTTSASRTLTSNKSYEGSIAFSDKTGPSATLGSYGLKVWAQNGTLRLDTSDRLLRLHSQVAFSYGSAPMYTYQSIYNFWMPTSYTTTVSVPGIRNDNKWHAHVSIGKYWRVKTINADSVTLFATLQYPYGYEREGYTSQYAASSGQITVYRV